MQLSLEQALREGIRAHKAGQFQEADKYYTGILKVKPKHPDANHNMGVLAVNIGRFKEALPFFKIAVEANPNIDQFWLSYIETLIKLDRLNDARNVLSKAKKKNPIFKGFGQLEQRLKLASAKKPKELISQRMQSEKLDQARKAQDPPENLAKTLVDLCIQKQFKKSKNQALKLLLSFPNSIVLYNIIGAANQGLGELDNALNAYEKAISIQPNFAEAYFNMGNVLQDQGKLKKAIGSFEKAVSINPNYAEAFNNMGVALQDQGKLEEAIDAYRKALSIKPDFSKAYNNLGVTLKNQNKLEEAVDAYEKALKIQPNYAEAYNNMGYALKNMKFTRPNQNIQDIITVILNDKTIIRPSDLSTAAISLLKLEPTIQRLLNEHAQDNLRNSFLEIVSELSKLPLLLKFISLCPLADLELETALTEIRSCILSSIFEISRNSNLLQFQNALALHCFTNEYIYNTGPDESKSLQKLEDFIKKEFSENKQPNPHSLLSLASYKALNEYEWCDALTVSDSIQEVFTRQISEPLEEDNLKLEMKLLGQISNQISSKVREQYEKNPYPRWVNLGLSMKPYSVQKVVFEESLRLKNPSITEIKSPQILIAGCGTGEHSIVTAAKFDNSEILAIDLSLSSLGYAKRKTRELHLENITYMQADILNLKKLNKKFDIIESIGVLHHMEDPMSGWKVLVDCLKPNGLMKIGLYSELARQSVVEIRKEISKSNISASASEILHFREALMKSDKESHKQIQSWRDFYSLSELKDLIFHVQEHRFTIPKIKECIQELGLTFCGFESDIAKGFRFKNIDKDTLYDLDQWNTFEQANPRAFSGMYQFWCQKT